MKRRVRASLLLVAAVAAASCGSSTRTNLTSPTDSRCQATVTNTASSYAGGGTGTVAIAVARECSWNASVTGTCPLIVFGLNGRTVYTTSSTEIAAHVILPLTRVGLTPRATPTIAFEYAF